MKFNICENFDDEINLKSQIDERVSFLKERDGGKIFRNRFNSDYSTSFNAFFTNENLVDVSSYPELQIKLDDENEIYLNSLLVFQKEIQTKDLQTAIIDTVSQTVYDFVGKTNRSENIARTYLLLTHRNSPTPISSFYGKDISECSERALLAQNLFQFYGINSCFVSGAIEINGTMEIHNYNILELGGNYYIFDLACTPTTLDLNGNIEKHPMIKKLDEKEANVVKDMFNNGQALTNLGEKVKPVSFSMASGNKYTVTYGKSNVPKHSEQTSEL